MIFFVSKEFDVGSGEWWRAEIVEVRLDVSLLLADCLVFRYCNTGLTSFVVMNLLSRVDRTIVSERPPPCSWRGISAFSALAHPESKLNGFQKIALILTCGRIAWSLCQWSESRSFLWGSGQQIQQAACIIRSSSASTVVTNI